MYRTLSWVYKPPTLTETYSSGDHVLRVLMSPPAGTYVYGDMEVAPHLFLVYLTTLSYQIIQHRKISEYWRHGTWVCGKKWAKSNLIVWKEQGDHATSVGKAGGSANMHTYLQGRSETCGRHRQPTFFENFQFRTGLEKHFEGACPNCGQFSEKLFRMQVRSLSSNVVNYCTLYCNYLGFVGF